MRNWFTGWFKRKEKKSMVEEIKEVAGFDIKKASREDLEAFALKQREVLEKVDAHNEELEEHNEGLDKQCSELAVENRTLHAQAHAATPPPARTERRGQAPRYIPPRKLEGAEFEHARLRVLERYGGTVIVHVGPTRNFVDDGKGGKKRVRDETKPAQETLETKHILGINEGDEVLTAILVDTQKLRIERSK